ncbi:MAG: hypothetical protein HY852_00360 [Bradyrhizobium sp.]|uniref:hypothetical protein n=1 Tax=Bradyrhizobium sp. TaxID=376 RepID=UPI0025BCCF7E|nr:hypothetical protein [Bradyrhizobium sp.]MBI5260253.1 hypothetical protein [Bradyrhizobium sp.]
MTKPQQGGIRYRVDPGDVPPEKAARRLHLTLSQFNEVLPKLQKRGFPKLDPDTGMFDLDEIDRWRKSRHRPAAPASKPTDQPGAQGEMAERFIAAHDRVRRRRKQKVAPP